MRVRIRRFVKPGAVISALDFPSSRSGDCSALREIPDGFTAFALPPDPLSGEVCLLCSSLELLEVLVPLDVRPFAL
jgi:hypothetical protein